MHRLKKFRQTWLEIEQSLSASVTNSSIKTERGLTISAFRVGKLSSPITVVSIVSPLELHFVTESLGLQRITIRV
jgi:hypothetical protein